MQTRRGTSVPNTSGRPVSDPANNGIPTPAAIRREGPERRRSPAGSLIKLEISILTSQYAEI